MLTTAALRDLYRAALASLEGWVESDADVNQFGQQSSHNHLRWSLGLVDEEYDDRQRGHLVTTAGFVLAWSHQMRIDAVQADQSAALLKQLELITAIRGTGTAVRFSTSKVERTDNNQWQIGRIELECTFNVPYGPLLKTTPMITGNVSVGDVLSIQAGEYRNSEIALTYDWLRDGATTGIVAATYTLSAPDEGSDISVAETADSGAGTLVTVTNVLGPVLASSFTTPLKVALIQPAEHSVAYAGGEPDSYRAAVLDALTDRSASVVDGFGLTAGLVSGTTREMHVSRAISSASIALIEQEKAERENHTGSLIQTGFEDRTIGAAAEVDFVNEFGSAALFDRVGRCDWELEGVETHVKTYQPKNAVGANQTGLTFRSNVAGAPTEAWATYDFRFDTGHAMHTAVKGSTKMSGLASNPLASGGTPSDGSAAVGWSSRWQAKAYEQLTEAAAPAGFLYCYQYMYYVDQPGIYGENVTWLDPDTGSEYLVEIGKWYRLQQHIKMNTTTGVMGGGSNDGVMEVWITEVVDGEPVEWKQVLNKTDVRWTDEVANISLFVQNNHLGGSGTDFEIAEDSFVSFRRYSVTAQADRPIDGDKPEFTVYVPPASDTTEAEMASMIRARRLLRGNDHGIVLVGRSASTLAAAVSLATNDALIRSIDGTAYDFTDSADMEPCGQAALPAIESIEAAKAATVTRLLTPGQLIDAVAKEGVALTCSTPAVYGSPTLTYQWQRDGADIFGERGATYTPTATDRTAVLSRVVSDGTYAYSCAGSNPSQVALKAATFNAGKYLQGPVPAIADDFTVSLWAKIPYTADGNNLVCAQTELTSGFFLTMYNSPTKLAMRVLPNSDNIIDDDGNIGDDTWVHVAARYTHATRYQELFVNGVRVEFATAASSGVAPTDVLVVGARASAGVQTHTATIGSIAGVYVFDSALSDSAIASAALGVQPTGAINSLALAGAALSLPAGWTEVGAGDAVSLSDGPTVWID